MDKYGGDLESFFDKPLEGLREELLAIWGDWTGDCRFNTSLCRRKSNFCG